MKRFYSLFLALFLLVPIVAHSKTVTIYFGGENSSPPFGYSPSSVTVNVGDTIVWMGNFAAPHTLVSESIPSGAASWSKTDMTGTSFSYVVTVPGTYNYECTIHVSLGMVGSFTAAAAGVDAPQAISMIMEPVYPNPAVNESMVDFTLDQPAHVTLRIFNALGDLIQTPTNEDMGAGSHMLMLSTKSFASGTYEYVLQAGSSVLKRSVLVVR